MRPEDLLFKHGHFDSHGFDSQNHSHGATNVLKKVLEVFGNKLVTSKQHCGWAWWPMTAVPTPQNPRKRILNLKPAWATHDTLSQTNKLALSFPNIMHAWANLSFACHTFRDDFCHLIAGFLVLWDV